MIVIKFGGTSIGTAERLRGACGIVKSRLRRNPLVVVSAHNSPECRMTDTILESVRKALEGEPDVSKVKSLQLGICDDLSVEHALVNPLLNDFERLLTGISMIGEVSNAILDQAMSFGERMSAIVFADVLSREYGIDAVCVPSYDLGMRTDKNFGNAIPLKESYQAISDKVREYNPKIIVTTGFLGKEVDGHITTLGRGGSDLSATIFAAAVGAEEVELWTDVDGVMTADPKIVPEARSVPRLSFMEASELAWYGARVLHPSTMIPAIEHNIPVRVLNTAKPDNPGTLILPSLEPGSDEVKSVVHKTGINLVTITTPRMLGAHGFLARVFEIFDRHEIDVQMVATSEISISLTIPRFNNLDKAVEELRKFSEVMLEQDQAIVCLIGENMAGRKGIAARACGALASAGVNIRMISQEAHEFNIALLVDGKDVETTVIALHHEFFKPEGRKDLK